MDSALTPRDIQARIRSGETLDEVAEAAGVPAASIEPFAAPVLAEREHLAGLAQDAPVRRAGEASSVGALGTVVAMSLLRAGVDADEATWDAWREPDRNWTVQASWTKGSDKPVALFGFDPRSRYSVARNDEARKLIGERAHHEPRVGHRDPDSEPTIDLNEELGIVHPITPIERPSPLPTRRPEPLQVEVEQPEDEDEVYDIVPNQSEMDVLYEMLSSFNEDSVNIYSGLDQAGFQELMASPTPPTLRPTAMNEDARDEDDHDPRPTGRHRPAAPAEPTREDDAAAEEMFAAQGIFDHDQPSAANEDEPVEDPEAHEPTRRIRRPSRAPAEPEVTEREQDALVEVDEEPGPAPKPKARKKKGRASVPSWDEIMFGSPKK